MGFPPPLSSFARILLLGVLMAAPIGGSAQTTTPPPSTEQHKPPHKEAFKPKPHTPVVRPHGAAHPEKPPAARQPAKPLPPAVPAEQAQTPATPAAPTSAAKPPEPAKPPGTTSLPLPRFAAMRSDDVNLRAGPGFRYPIEWVYKRRDLPVQIEREFEVWRLVRDADGIRGWVHEATLTGRRTFLIQGADATLRNDAKDDASAVAVLKIGVIGRIRSCEANSDWCKVQVGDYRGYLKREQFWGTLPNEAIAP